jgi:hypothetical protein
MFVVVLLMKEFFFVFFFYSGRTISKGSQQSSQSDLSFNGTSPKTTTRTPVAREYLIVLYLGVCSHLIDGFLVICAFFYYGRLKF